MWKEVPVDFEFVLEVTNKPWPKLYHRWMECSFMFIENQAF